MSILRPLGYTSHISSLLYNISAIFSISSGVLKGNFNPYPVFGIPSHPRAILGIFCDFVPSEAHFLWHFILFCPSSSQFFLLRVCNGFSLFLDHLSLSSFYSRFLIIYINQNCNFCFSCDDTFNLPRY